MNPDLLTAKEVRQILRIGLNSIYDLARARKIEYIRIGDRILFPRAAVEAFICANTVSPKRDFFSMNRRGLRNNQPQRGLPAENPEQLAESHKEDELHSSSPETSLRRS